MRHIAITLFTGFLFCSVSVKASENDANHPSLTIDNNLPELVKQMRRDFVDPRSIIDLQICDPVKVKWKNGEPVRWTLQFAANSKGRMGGYTGLKTYAAIFKLKKSPRIIETGIAGDGGFDGMINDAIWKQIVDCPRISDEQLKELLG